VAEFDPQRMLDVLARNHVRYVLIGGFAAAIHGSPYVTTDVDIVPADDRENLDHLSDALRELGARVRTDGVDGGVAFDHDGASLAAGQIWNLTTDAGDLDITFVPSGTSGYRDVVRDAEKLQILGVAVAVASLADVVRSKEAAGRDKDRVQLPLLRRLLEEGDQGASR
jgi:predicted nucleotidyltransferase